ncbi:hypothetical protein GHT06_022218 [Daphnia sinensis]|uniref:Uncharacterized protein n=1 Tax=Daphnia sinensis TaxID=1820382 RepID=A0AAD5PMB5_9CRUS|nr:hypothetical protein GHT06_022218 [Daphnia sinensis]
MNYFSLFLSDYFKIMERKTGSWASLIDRSINKPEKLEAAALGGEMNDGTPAMKGSIGPEQPFDLIEE